MPRQPKHLPYVRRTSQGRLQYYRRVAPEHRHLFGNKGAFTVQLECDPSRPRSKAAIAAWEAANAEYESRITTKTGTSTGDGAVAPVKTALSPRDAAGIAAEPLKNLLSAGDSGQITTEMEDKLATLVQLAAIGLQQAASPGGLPAAQRIQSTITQELVGDLLNQLHITPDVAAMQAIQARLFGYLGTFGDDVSKRSRGDYSQSELENISPPVPQSQVTYEVLFNQWLIDGGGRRSINGTGVSDRHISFYQAIIKEISEVTKKDFPAAVTIDDARGYVNYLQGSSYAITTRQRHISAVKTLFTIGVRYGLLNSNPFSQLTIKAPKNSRTQSYRPYTREELRQIVEEINRVPDQRKAMIIKVLIGCGARSSDVSLLRHKDIKQTESGIWFFDFVDEPTSKYPHPLKGAATDERHVPIHPWIIQQGFLELVHPGQEGYIFGTQKSDLIAQWFQYILKRLGIYETRVTTVHSFRHTFIDLMRDAGVTVDARRAMTGHSSKDVQDRTYGEGLQKMPAVLHKELIKVDLSWLP